MASIAIDRFKARYRAPAHATAERPRLQRIVADALTRTLEGAVERAGVATDGHLCVRDLRTTVTLRLREPDSFLAVHIGEAIAQALADALQSPSPSIIYYRSRVQALVDLAVGATSGDFARSWAWNQMGIWRVDFPMSATAAADPLVRALAREPRHASAVAVHLARRHPRVLETMIAQATSGAWTALARAAVDASGGAIESIASAAAAIGGPVPFSLASPVIAASAIARAATGHLRDRPAELVRAVAALVLVEVEPAILGHARAGRLIAAVERALSIAAPARDVVREENVAIDGGRDPRRTVVSADFTGDEATAREAAHDERDATRLAGERPARVIEDVRREAPTEWGGLLYLITLADRIGLPATILADPRWDARGLRWVLHRLAMDLAGVGPSDPAALAFAGLPPDAEPPSATQPAPVDANVLRDLRASLVRALRDTLDRHDESDATLLDQICRRHARISADPGWIDVHLLLDDVSIEIRRAGLDRDPGWVPWLGIVVRFRYA